MKLIFPKIEPQRQTNLEMREKLNFFDGLIQKFYARTQSLIQLKKLVYFEEILNEMINYVKDEIGLS